MIKSLIRTILFVFCLFAPVFHGLEASCLKKLVPFSVLTFNIENGGTQIDFNKVIEAIRKSKADVVGIQEAWGHTDKIAKALGWKYFSRKEQIISRYPLFQAKNSNNLYLFIEIRPHKFVAMANMHLPDDPYGPDLVKAGKSTQEIIANEKKVRLPTALPYIKALVKLVNKGIPVFLTGDFNSPSNLNWSKKAVGKLRGYRKAVPWPVTKTLENMGFLDSYHFKHSNSVKQPGFSWPARRPFITSSSMDGYNPSPTDIPDRLDFIFTDGDSWVVSSQLIGEAHNKNVDIHVSPWPSDHRAVVSRFKVLPAYIPLKKLVAVRSYFNQTSKALVTVSKNRIKSGHEFTIYWHNAPGNRYDFIRITPEKNAKLGWGEAIRLYTHATHSGSLVYSMHNAQGNWLAWHRANQGHWPMLPGVYDVKLIADDGYTVLAATKITIY